MVLGYLIDPRHKGTKTQGIMEFSKLTEHEEKIGKAVVQAALKVHKELGPGLLEKIY